MKSFLVYKHFGKNKHIEQVVVLKEICYVRDRVPSEKEETNK